MLAAILAVLTLSPRPSADLAARAWGVPSGHLRAICYRESRCAWVGEHPGDRWLGPLAHAKAWRRGLLWAPWQRFRGGWGTRGPWGLISAYHAPWGLPAQALDLPVVSAWIAARKLRRIRDGVETHPASIRWACTRIRVRWCADRA